LEYWELGHAQKNVIGTLKALRKDVESGYLTRFEELVHADLFSDFLEMAKYLLEEGYKDPAAVLIGGVLEGHLRALCEKNDIETETTNSKGQVRSKNAQIMNQDLAKENVYGKLDQKSVTAWLDLRNKASHGRYDEYSNEQVELLLLSVRDFLVRYPASSRLLNSPGPGSPMPTPLGLRPVPRPGWSPRARWPAASQSQSSFYSSTFTASGLRVAEPTENASLRQEHYFTSKKPSEGG